MARGFGDEGSKNVVAQHFTMDALPRRDDCGDLVCDVEAVALVFNHSLQAAHLPFYASQAR